MNYYPFHIGDYASATRHLSWDEDMAYRRLIDAYYTREAPIPLDRRQAYRLTCASTPEQREAIDTVLSEFFTETPEGWRNNRCDEEIQAAALKREKAAQSAHARWNGAKAKQSDCEGNANASGNECERINAPCEGNAPNPNPKVSTDVDTKSADKPRRFDPLAIDLPNCIPADDWSKWVSYRRKRKLSNTEDTIRAQLANLEAWSSAGHDPARIIADSIANGWQGLFEPKQAANARASPRANIHAEREAVSLALTGRRPTHDRTIANERDITAESIRIA